MKKLKFNREAAQRLLSKKYSLDEKTTDLMLIRAELLARNEHFIRDLKELKKKPKGSQTYRKQLCRLRKKWKIIGPLDPDPNIVEDGKPIPLRFALTTTATGSVLFMPSKVNGYVPSDLEDYALYLKVWDLKKNKSWREVLSEMQEEIQHRSVQNHIETVRNWHKAACRLIERGIPGLPPFPQE